MSRGVVIVDPETGDWSLARPGSLGEPGNLPALAQTAIALSDEMVFAGTWGGGVYRAAVRENPFQLFGEHTLSGHLQHRNISAVMATDAAGVPWIGSFGGGVQRLDANRAHVDHFVEADDPIFDAGVLSIARDGAGRLFAGTSVGLFEFNEQGQTVVLADHRSANGSGLGPGYVTAVLAASDGALWVGVGGSGLYRRAPGSTSFERLAGAAGQAGALGDDYVTTLLETPPGTLWVGTRSNGLSRCQVDPWVCEQVSARGDDDDPDLRSARVTDIYLSRDQRLWVATDGAGLAELLRDPAGKATGLRHWGRQDGMLTDGIMAIAEDLDESLWLSTRHGLSRLDPDTGEFVNHVAASGLPVSHFNAGAADVDERFIYFGSVEGLLALPKGTPLRPRTASPVRMSLAETARRGEQLRPVSAGNGPLRIDYATVLSMTFAVLDFTESTHEYAFRLRPSDPWTTLGARREVTLYGLPPGHYAVQARGRDAFGHWGETPPFEFEVVPPFWMQTWFRLMVALVLVLAGIALHRARLERQRRLAREIQRLSERRETALEQALGPEAELAALTPRQKEVLQLIAEGYSAREISDLLDVSIKTVQAHRANLMERLDIHDVPGLVRLAIRARLVSPHE